MRSYADPQDSRKRGMKIRPSTGAAASSRKRFVRRKGRRMGR